MANVNRMIFFPAMWPLGTTAPVIQPPRATWALIGLHLCLLAVLFLAPAAVMEHFALPVDWKFYQFLTYAFAPANLAGGLLSVMLLWTYGPGLESRLGPWRFLLIYGASAMIGGVAHQLLQAGGAGPLMGAAAGICGLIGATLVLSPRAMVRFYIGIYFLITPIFARVLLIHIAGFAMIYAIAELLLVQLDQATELSFVLEHSVFSISAHLGGLLTGVALAAFFCRRPATPPEVEIPKLIRDQKQALKPTAVIHEPLGPYRKSATAVTVDSQPEQVATIAQIDPDRNGGGAAAVEPKAEETPIEKLFRQRLLFADDEEEDALALPEAEAINKSTIDLFDSSEAADAIPQLSCAPVRSAPANPMRDLTAAEASHPPLVIPMLEAEASHAGKAAAPESPGAPAMRIADAFGTPQAPDTPVSKKSEAEPADPAAFEIHMETSEDTQGQALQLRDRTDWPDLRSGRFAVILAPGRPMNLTPIVEVMAHSMGLAPQAAYGKLVRRRGILADNLGCEEAEHVAAEFARAGHPVLVAALTGRIEFGEGLDLVAVQDQGEHVRFATVAQVIPAAWSQVVFLAAGEVSLRPGLPGRTVMDIFLVQPRHHLRLWDNTFSYTRETPRFRPLVELFTRKATGAIHTSSLDKWLKGEKYTLHHFSSMLEYNYYLRWHLLAHLAPTKQFISFKF